jgi:hypothetical protein
MDQLSQSTSNQNPEAKYHEESNMVNRGYAHIVAHSGFTDFFWWLTQAKMHRLLAAIPLDAM